eukprot:1322119-Rhodomonas_salina.1
MCIRDRAQRVREQHHALPCLREPRMRLSSWFPSTICASPPSTSFRTKFTIPALRTKSDLLSAWRSGCGRRRGQAEGERRPRTRGKGEGVKECRERMEEEGRKRVAGARPMESGPRSTRSPTKTKRRPSLCLPLPS